MADATIPPAAPYVAPQGIDANLADFIKMLHGPNGNDGIISDYMNEASRLRGIGTGASDPAFAEFQNAQNAQLSANQRADTAQQAEFFNRRGMGDSSNALNQMNKTAASYNLQRGTLASQIGLQALSRRDDAFASALNAESAGVSTAAKPAELAISELAAANAGRGGGSSGGGMDFGSPNFDINRALLGGALGGGAGGIEGGFSRAVPGLGGGGGGGTVLCTMLYQHGDLPLKIYRADGVYGKRYIPAIAREGYHVWAKPLVRLAEKNPILYRTVRPFVSALAHRLAHKLGAETKPHYGGQIVLALMWPPCLLFGSIGRLVAYLQAKALLVQVSQ